MVLHLPPAIKHLLTLRNPNVLPGPPAAKLNAILSSTFRDARVKKAETGWLVLTVGRGGASGAIAEQNTILIDLYAADGQSPFDHWATVQLCDSACGGKEQQQHAAGN